MAESDPRSQTTNASDQIEGKEKERGAESKAGRGLRHLSQKQKLNKGIITMTLFMAIISFVIILTIALLSYARYARADMNRLFALDMWSDYYFNYATKFVENENSPHSLLMDIQELTCSLDDPRTSAKLLRILKTMPINRIKADRFGEIFRFLHREGLESAYREMAKSYVLFISYKDKIRGHMIRNLLDAAGKSEPKISANSEDTRAVDAVDALLAAEHATHCLTSARS
jgi:hypothetical protein